MARMKAFERQLLVQQQRQPEPQRELQDRREHRVDDRVGDREPEHRVVPQVLIVLEADEDSGPADLRIGEAEPDAEPERIGQEDEQDRRRRQQEQDAEHRPVLGQSGEAARSDPERRRLHDGRQLRPPCRPAGSRPVDAFRPLAGGGARRSRDRGGKAGQNGPHPSRSARHPPPEGREEPQHPGSTRRGPDVQDLIVTGPSAGRTRLSHVR